MADGDGFHVGNSERVNRSPTSSDENTLSKGHEGKELHVGYFIFEPAIMECKQCGKLKGVYVDLVEEIAKSLGDKCRNRGMACRWSGK